jgi:hydroxymethylbilane synthase
VDHLQTRVAAAAERAVLATLGGGCLLPLGAWARLEEGRLVLTAALDTGGTLRRVELAGDAAAPEELGERVAARLR